jgi:hypothetical protein
MSINKTTGASSAPATAEIRSLIINEFARWHANDGTFETAIPGFTLTDVPLQLSSPQSSTNPESQ